MTDAPQPAVSLRLDRVPGQIAGWAAASDPDRAEDPLTLGLTLGGVLLGTIRRDQARPDVDAHLGYAGSPKGFRLPDHGLRAFAAVGELDQLVVSVEGADAALSNQPLPEWQASTDGFASLGSRHGVGKAIRLVDLWMADDRTLSLRFEGDATTAKSLDAYQCWTDRSLVNIAADRIVQGSAAIVTVSLMNRFAPVLLVFRGEDGSLDAIDWLPFPSLARGGLHAAERLIAGHGGDDLADTATVCDQLVANRLAGLQRPQNCVAILQLDPAIHTGLEPCLDEDLLQWIGGSLGLGIRQEGEGADTPEFISERIERYSGPLRSGAQLSIPADSVPTISALVTPLPDGAAEQTVTGGIGIADWSRHGSVWSVWQPPFANRLAGLQPAHTPQPAPTLTVGPQFPADGGEEISLRAPLAIAVREQPVRISSSSPFEIAPEVHSPLVDNGEGGTQRVSVLVLSSGKPIALGALLESLAEQADINIGNLLLCVPDGHKDAQLAKVLTRQFDGRHGIRSQPPTAGRLEQIVSTRAELGDEDVVVVIDSATLLPDPRTLAMLVRMLGVPDVSSAGCLVRAANEKLTPICAGYSLSQVNLRSAPALAFDPIDPDVWRHPATYPVVASPLALLVTRRRLLANVSANGSSYFRPEVDDLLLGIQLIEQGGVNLCTTAVSAYSAAASPRSSQLGFSIPYRLQVESIMRITESTTLVQRVA